MLFSVSQGEEVIDSSSFKSHEEGTNLSEESASIMHFVMLGVRSCHCQLRYPLPMTICASEVTHQTIRPALNSSRLVT